ncbi:MAG: PLP-dependent aminotransferase family protein [Ruminococcaceae bacterium]|nr:PLP-dependent aminotransferase family protein [Oscillospiraceae bacterium]
MDITTKFSDRVKHLEASAIREIFKLLAKPGIISFAGGAPDPELFPKKEFAELAKEILETQGNTALQYGITEGYAPLRQWVKERLIGQGVLTQDDDVIIGSGGQQGIDLATKSLINPGDGVICEEPSFIGGLNCFRSYRAELYGVPVLSDGIDTEKLEELLKEHKNIKVLYTIATFQNPSGITISLEKRKKILELADKYDFLIYEDNPYGELRFSGEEIPTMKSLDKNDRVIYFGSFSKILAPGMRLGFVSAPVALLERMIICKQTEDVHTNVLSQMIAYEFVTRNSIDEHIAKLRAAYGKKCKLMMDCMDKYFPSEVEHTCPEGGLFLYCTMPDGYDSKELMKKALEKNVAFVPGTSCMIDDKATYSTFRMNYSTASEEDIEKGIKALGEVLHEFMGK